MLYVSVFRMPDDRNHAVVAGKVRVPRNGTYRTVCQQVVGDDAQRIAPRNQGDHDKAAVIQCDICVDGTSY